MGKNVSTLVNFSLSNFEKNVKKANKSSQKATQVLLKADHTFNSKYIEYLNKCAQGVLRFDAPKPYIAPIDKLSFEKLFIKYVGKTHHGVCERIFTTG